MRTRNSMLLAAAAIALVSITSCSGGGGASTAGTAARAVGAGGGTAAVPAGQPKALPALGRPPVADRSIIYTANLTVQTRDVAAAAARAESIAADSGGYVFSSDSAVDPSAGAATSATVVLKVPPRAFATVLDSLARLGTPLGRNQRADDVTDSVVDVAARVRAQQASLARVRTLLAQARTVGEVVAVESELTKREADLESLQGRQRALSAQVGMSTVTLRLVSPAPAAVASEARGFLPGLRIGWHAFARALVASLTVLGALLPFVAGLGLILLVALPLRRLALARRRAATAGR